MKPTLWTVKRIFIGDAYFVVAKLKIIARNLMVPSIFRCGLRGFAVAVGLVAFLAPAAAEVCPGHPDAIGTSRTIVVDPTKHPRIGTMQYEETLPLRDHEVVLTFDDGPLPAHSTPTLDILASQCVKATFFIIGRMAKAFPDGVRRVRDAGHSIGTHSQNHPLSFERMPLERVKQEVEEGIASTKAALGNEADLAPFFRIPGLLRSAQVEQYLASRGLMTWSADFPADDWRHIPPARVVSLALSRIEAKGKGVLLLHDIQARTVAALPTILRQLKARGYRIVHVVPATPDRPETPTERQDWRLGPSDISAALKWPKTQPRPATATVTTSAPGLTNLGIVDTAGQIIAMTERGAARARKPRVPIPPEPVWPRQISLIVEARPTVLAIPAADLFQTGTVPNDGLLMTSTHRAAAQLPAATASQPVREVMNESAAGKLLPGAWSIHPSGLQPH